MRLYPDIAGVTWAPVTHSDGREGWVQVRGDKQIAATFQTSPPKWRAAEKAPEPAVESAVPDMSAVISEAVEKAIKDERFRISMILNSPYYEGREVQARAMIDEGMSLSAAERVLQTLPAEKPAAPMGSAQAAAMKAMFAETPAIKPDPKGDPAETAESNRQADLSAAIADVKTAKYGARR